MADEGPKKRKVKHALICWIESQQKTVVLASKIPREKQFADAIADLWWSEGGKRRKFKAKVIALSYDAAELDNLASSSGGTHVSGKMFSQHVLDDRQKLIENNGSTENHTKNVQATGDNFMIEDPGIFGDFKQNLTQESRTTTDEPQLPSAATSHYLGLVSTHELSSVADLSNSSSSIDEQKHSVFLKSHENLENEASFKAATESNINQENHGVPDRQTMDWDDKQFKSEASAIAQVMKHKVTASEVKSAKLYAAALEIAYNNQQKMGNTESTQISDSSHHAHEGTPKGIIAKIDAQIEKNNYSPADDKVELWLGCRFYLHRMDYEFVRKSATFNGVLSWGALVTNMLMEIYGRNIAYYSATGHRLSKSPGIDKRLYRGLYGWVENLTKNDHIDKSTFNAHINHLISNKRRYMPEFNKSQRKAKSGITGKRKSRRLSQ